MQICCKSYATVNCLHKLVTWEIVGNTLICPVGQNKHFYMNCIQEQHNPSMIRSHDNFLPLLLVFPRITNLNSVWVLLDNLNHWPLVYRCDFWCASDCYSLQPARFLNPVWVTRGEG